MSRKSLRNASKHASKKSSRGVAAGRPAGPKLGLSGLALGSVTFGLSGMLQAQNAQPAQSATNTPKPKAADRAPGKSNRWRAVKLAASSAAPPPAGAGPVAQADP